MLHILYLSRNVIIFKISFYLSRIHKTVVNYFTIYLICINVGFYRDIYSARQIVLFHS